MYKNELYWPQSCSKRLMEKDKELVIKLTVEMWTQEMIVYQLRPQEQLS